MKIAGAAAVLAAALFYKQILGGLGSDLVHIDPLPANKADIVLVLDGDWTGRRILTAANLVREGHGPSVLVSCSGDVYGLNACQLAISFAVRQGFPESYFVPLVHSTHSTEAEAAVALNWIRQHGLHRVLLVTTDYHTARATRIYRAHAPDITFTTIAAPDEFFTPQDWWRNREGRKTFLLEWTKTVAGWLGM